MAVIDQRILLIAPSEAIWPYLTEPALISRWNREARQVSILTTRPAGIGLRRRITGPDSKSVVEQITAWVENMGFEIIQIEGPYRSFRGRMRLQPVPEGTVLSWVIEYQLRGPFGGLRNTFGGHRRKLARQMSDSLRALRRLIESSGVQLDRDRQQRVAMQADPGLAARQARMSEPTVRQGPGPAPVAAYAPQVQARSQPLGEDDLPELPPPQITGYPTSVPTSVPTTVPKSAPTQAPIPATFAAQPTVPPAAPKVPAVPPLVRPPAGNPPVIGNRPQPPIIAGRPVAEPVPNPVTLPPARTAPPAQIPEPPISLDDTKPSARATAEHTAAAEPVGNGLETVPVELVAPKPPPLDPEPPTATQEIPSVPPPLMDIPHALTPEDATRQTDEGRTRSEPAPTRDMPPVADIEDLTATPAPVPREKDGAHASIWDVFGIPRPSQKDKDDLGVMIAGLKPKLPDAEPEPARGAVPPVNAPLVNAPPVDVSPVDVSPLSAPPISVPPDRPPTLPEPKIPMPPMGPQAAPPPAPDVRIPPAPPVEAARPAEPSAAPEVPPGPETPPAPVAEPPVTKAPPAEGSRPPAELAETREIALPWADLPPAMLSIFEEPPTPAAAPSVAPSVPPVPASAQRAVQMPLAPQPDSAPQPRRPGGAVRKTRIKVRVSHGPVYGKAVVKVRTAART